MNKKVIFIGMLTILLSLLYVLFMKSNMFVLITFVVVSLWIYTTFKVLIEFLLYDAVANACSLNWFVLVMLLYSKYDELMLSSIFCAYAILRIILVNQPVLSIVYFILILSYIYILYNKVKEFMVVYNVLVNNESI